MLLLATSTYDVWLITWPDGSGLSPHDHGGSRSVMHVIDGEIVETTGDHADERGAVLNVLHKGESTCGGSSTVHDITNRSGADATTIHVYSPPLSDVTFFNLDPAGKYERLHTSPVVERVPQASSEDLAPRSRGRQLSLVRS
jgi:predicted metal-dependent enzyme (double-stranded beta helix superfamily)